jgi:hypothetical protein
MCEGAKCLGKCNALAKATLVYVGADLSPLAGAEDIIAVEHIFKSFSDSKIVIQAGQFSIYNRRRYCHVGRRITLSTCSSPHTSSILTPLL